MMGEKMNDRSVPFPFDPEDDHGSYRYVLVADHLVARIRSGEFDDHPQLPSEVDLARQYGVSLGTMRHATHLLRERGLVKTVRSKGTYVIGQTRYEQADGRDVRGLSVNVSGADRPGNCIPILHETPERNEHLQR